MELNIDWNMYELRARVFPAIIVGVPAVIAIAAYFDNNNPLKGTILWSSIIGIPLFFLFVNMVRHCGVACQERLWKSWGGPYSTQFLCRDSTQTSPQERRRINQQCESRFGLPLPLDEADKTKEKKEIEDIWIKMREYVRENNPNGIWDKNNAEYGFARNLYGSRYIILALGLVATVVASLPFLLWEKGFPNLYFIVGYMYWVISAIIIIVVVPRMANQASKSYVQNVIASFLQPSS